jgi:diguanylate cyclase
MDLNDARQRSGGIHFTPTVDLRTARVIGVSTRARANPEPVIELAIQAAGDWWRSGLGLQLAVSLPPTALSDADGTLDQLVARTLSGSGLPADALQVGVTEDSLTSEGEAVAATLGRLRERGVTISIDRFGIGRFSIRDLVHLPIHELSVDPSLIADLSTHEGGTVIRATVHLAHQIGLLVAVEGVRTASAWRRLRRMGVDRATGPLLSEPLTARDVPAWLAAWNQRARELGATGRVQRQPRQVA